MLISQNSLIIVQGVLEGDVGCRDVWIEGSRTYRVGFEFWSQDFWRVSSRTYTISGRYRVDRLYRV